MNGLENINWAPLEYMTAAFPADEARAELLQRIQWMTVQPRCILDVGAGTGSLSHALKQHYPAATIIALDNAWSMIQHAKQSYPSLACIYSDAGSLPLRAHSVDIIFANFLLPWHAPDVKLLLHEWRRVLSAEGLLMLTALGPNTLQEVQHMLPSTPLPHRIDMHDLGDALLASGFVDTVVDVDHYTVNYSEPSRLVKELTASGMLITDIKAEEIILQAGLQDISYEVIYAHAFAPRPSQTSEGEVTEGDATKDVTKGEVTISLQQVRQQLQAATTKKSD